MHVECAEVGPGPAFVSKVWRRPPRWGPKRPWSPIAYLLSWESHDSLVRGVQRNGQSTWCSSPHVTAETRNRSIVARHHIGMRKTTISNRGVGDLRHLELLTIDEFSQLFSISPRSVYSLIAAGVVRRVKVGRLTRIHRSEIERYAKYLQATSGHKGGLK